ncbi:transcriptional regulator [Thioflavicoccus mobilis 8321]|uniref:Transcriptional regulator n=1 Tax=Thioflavicoccus mobilis 8321 TaxID=765912 RepID=L0GVA1_9GAMM|nr:HTH-type transcriptional regulator CysB [Thioflavicoccus mobilis]AGA89757.1 transcriptional regulator [Thioflavicoccus mobilis 8321]
MNLQQLRYVQEIARRGLNVSEAAESLHTSQPGISKQIRQLEAELGIEIFVRHGKRLVEVTEPGRQVLAIAARLLGDLDNLRQVGREFSDKTKGRLAIATTHTQARYTLPTAIQAFIAAYPGVELSLHQGNPSQICEMVLRGEADMAIATEAIADHADLLTLPCYRWNRVVVAPLGHPLLAASRLTLEDLADWPIVTYDAAFAGRSRIDHAFQARGLAPRVVLSAADSDVIKTYVRMGLGLGIVAEMAYDPVQDADLGVLDAAHLFETSVTSIGLRRNAWLRSYVYAFIEGFAPHLTRAVVERTLVGGGSAFDI